MKNFLTITFIIAFTGIALPQSQKFFDAPFGGGGGFTPTFYFTNFDAINSKLAANNFPEFSDKGIFTTGGGGYIYIGFIKYLRIGGMGFGGMVSNNFSDAVKNYQIDYSVGGGGVTLEYTLPFIKDIGVSLGAIIGRSSLTMEIFQNGRSYSWDEILSPSSQNNLLRISKTSWMLSPTLNIDYPIYRFISLRIGTGYHFSFAGDWKANNDQVINGVPDNLNSKSFFIQLGIFGGFFSF
uniref:Outer membrane protein beta-barrel domain-containing protein n=1 Tax=Ignavibacterium album TaxID=591197 RepID=A0A832G7M9_9BACT